MSITGDACPFRKCIVLIRFPARLCRRVYLYTFQDGLLSWTFDTYFSRRQPERAGRGGAAEKPLPEESVFNNARGYRHAAADSHRPEGGTASAKGEGSFHAQLKSPVSRVNGLLLSATDERQILVRYRSERRWQWYRHPSPLAPSPEEGGSRLFTKFLIWKAFY